ncbi:alpha-aminoadipate/glutamate carrier protein LysW [Vagococcus sp. WN89Y]|uniref:alpha-aminoadipate/glutamate carrier protein LysW n=1 Tax=Vagococcus sp. WN89Y TaxID=3457258 RepID=UPI003FCE4AD8
MKAFKCLTCSSSITVSDDILTGEIVECGACGQEHELINDGQNYRLEFAPEVEEDWGE